MKFAPTFIPVHDNFNQSGDKQPQSGEENGAHQTDQGPQMFTTSCGDSYAFEIKKQNCIYL